MKDAGWLGERVIRLETTLYKPEGTGPFPVMIFNHGSSNGPIPSSYIEKAAALGNRGKIHHLDPNQVLKIEQNEDLSKRGNDVHLPHSETKS
ncbi:hypothetical protein [Noviherbaspirillum galbum]|uniref:Uncharacterized protein n=1 Tax=Noviherbaspirillum galbum TaxID=2709383 RepID=A0A6B3SME4_9BURK|nr:hypothetical protein [Noviherbaspirillum galbum]NEX61951.1 hypothetical protein [Noviherbaspirillum galbum]